MGLGVAGGSYLYPEPTNATDVGAKFDRAVFTAMFLGTQDAASNVNYGFCRGHGSAAPGWGVGLHSGSNNGVFARVGNFSYSPSSAGINTILVPRSTILVADGSTATVYQDGAAIASGAYTPPTYEYAPGSQRRVWFGSYSPSGAAQPIRPAVGLFWDRPLFPAEVAQINANPWQLFAPQPRRLWAVGDVAGTPEVIITGAGAVSLEPVATAASGSVACTGQAAAALSPITSAAAGTAVITGAGAVSLGPVATAASGTLTSSGQAAAALSPATSVAAGTTASTGAGATSLGPMATTASGTVASTGQAAVALAPITSAAVAVAAITGAGTATLQAVTTAGSGTVDATQPAGPAPITGAGSAALGPITTTGAGTVSTRGSGAAALQPVTVQATGTVAVRAAGAAVLAAASSAGAGAVSTRGSGAATLPSLSTAGAGAAAITATAAVQLGAVATSGTGESHAVTLPDRPAEGRVRALPRIGHVRGEGRVRRARYMRNTEGIMAIGTQHTYDKLSGEAKTWGLDFAEFFDVGERDDTPTQALIDLEPGITATVVGIQGRVVWFHVPPGGARGDSTQGVITLKLSSGDIEQAQIRVRIR